MGKDIKESFSSAAHVMQVTVKFDELEEEE
jgi:hypothetical protein